MSFRKKPRLVRFKQLGIYVFESKHSPDFLMETEARDFQKLALIVKGAGVLETERYRVDLSPNHLIYIPAALPHRLQDDTSNPMTLVMCCFFDRIFIGSDFAAEALETFKQCFQNAAPYNLSDNFTRAEVMNKFRRMLFEQIHHKPNSRAVIWSELLEILVFLSRNFQEMQRLEAESSGSRAFAGTLRYLDDNFFKPIKVETLAAMANMSYRSFTEHFKKTTDKTVIEYLTEMRVEYAKKLMIETENILYAAFESGFGDVAHFYRVFKKITGKTPQKFILTAKAGERAG